MTNLSQRGRITPFLIWREFMKKKSILNLIRCYAENNDIGFRSEAREIANEFDRNGDTQLAMYILSLLSSENAFIPQQCDDEFNFETPFISKVTLAEEILLLPDAIMQDLMGILNAVRRRMGTNKFLFQGKPGTGKTQAVKQITRLLGRELFVVNESALIDSKLGQTQKNISSVFRALSTALHPEKIVVLFDELDALALNRMDTNDLREMGRATTEILKGLDSLNEDIVLIATTNLFNCFDKALSRRFDFIVDFDRYEEADLVEIAEKMLERYLNKVKLANRDVRLFRKILSLAAPLPQPGDIFNIVKTAVAFSNPENGFDYMRRLYKAFCGNSLLDLHELQTKGFTIREIGILTGQSKSYIGRELMEGNSNA